MSEFYINKYPFIVVKNDDDYIALSTDLIGCLADGKTPEEAMHNLKPAMLEWLDEAKERRISIPAPRSVSLNASIALLNNVL